MNDNKKLAAFMRTALREGITSSVKHPFAEAVNQFCADVDLLGTTTADGWFESHKEQAELVNKVYEAYITEEPVEEVAEPVTEADNTVSEIEKLQARIQALEDAQKPAPQETPAAEEPPAQEG